jgi:hypothetical protein
LEWERLKELKMLKLEFERLKKLKTLKRECGRWRWSWKGHPQLEQ